MNDTTDRAALRPNRELVDPMRVSDIGARGALVPTTGGEALEMAKLLSTGKFSVPKFLQGNPGDCLRLVAIAMRTGLDVWMLAGDTYLTTSKKSGETSMNLGAKSIHAIVLASGALQGDLTLSYAGEGEGLTVTVEGVTRSGTRHVESYGMRSITTRNSPLWQTQPRQQLGYYGVRAWCRLHAPAAIMGLVAREEAGMLDITDDAREEPAPSDVEKVLAVLEPPPKPEPEPPPDAPTEGEVHRQENLEQVAREVATLGGDRLDQHWRCLTHAERATLEPIGADLRRIADQADREMAAEGGGQAA